MTRFSAILILHLQLNHTHQHLVVREDKDAKDVSLEIEKLNFGWDLKHLVKQKKNSSKKLLKLRKSNLKWTKNNGLKWKKISGKKWKINPLIALLVPHLTLVPIDAKEKAEEEMEDLI